MELQAEFGKRSKDVERAGGDTRQIWACLIVKIINTHPNTGMLRFSPAATSGALMSLVTSVRVTAM